MPAFNEENIVCSLVFCVRVLDANRRIFFKHILSGAPVVSHKWTETLIKLIFSPHTTTISLQVGSGGMAFIDWACSFYFEM